MLMTRIEIVREDKATGKVEEIYADIRRAYGMVPNA